MPKKLKSVQVSSISAVFVLAVCGCSYDYKFYTQTSSARTSELWGVNGELWSPSSRLPDYSFAGYRSGEKSIPTPAIVANVKDFGATSNDDSDDSAAFRNALASASSGAVFVPNGTYRINTPVTINKSNVVLRGESQSGVIIVGGPVPGDCSRNNDPPHCAPYGGIALIQIVGTVGGSKVTSVSSNASRGSRTLHVSSASSLSPGQFVRLRMTNPPDNSLGCHLYMNAGCLNAERRQWYGGSIIDWVVQIEGISGNTITLVRPLRIDLRTNWSPEIWSFSPSVQDSGIENMTIQFTGTPFTGGTNQGEYGIYIGSAYNNWVRNVTIVDADRGVEIGGGYNTISSVTLKTRLRQPVTNSYGDITGHYGFAASGPRAQDNLFINGNIETAFGSNMSVGSFANGNVYSKMSSKIANLDHHAGAPYENLYTEISLQDGQGLFRSGGNRADEPNGTRTTVWNLIYDGSSSLGISQVNLPQANIIGVKGIAASKPTQTCVDWWVEPWLGSQTLPPNLHEAQFQRRKNLGFPVPALTTTCSSSSRFSETPLKEGP